VRRQQVDVRQLAARRDRDRLLAVRPVHGHIAQPAEELRGAVPRLVDGQQIRALLDERGAEITRDEGRIIQHGAQERDVGGDAADAELRQRTLRAGDGRREVAGAARQLGEHRVEMRTDLRAGRRGSAVETDAGAAG
jgi:hypothetical protein